MSASDGVPLLDGRLVPLREVAERIVAWFRVRSNTKPMKPSSASSRSALLVITHSRGQRDQIPGKEDRTGALIFTSSQTHEGQRVSPESLRRLFSSLRKRPSLVVFTACHSSELAELLAPHSGHAIGFGGELGDDAARHFSAVLYERLAAQDPPDIPHAFALAQIAAVSAGFSEIENACLFDENGVPLVGGL